MIRFWKSSNAYDYMGSMYGTRIIITRDLIDSFPDPIKRLGIFRTGQFILDGLCDRKKYGSLEQFRVTAIALLFKDTMLLDLIAQEPDPRVLRGMATKIKNYMPAIWEHYAVDLMIIGNYLKYTQSQLLGRRLCDTGTKYLFEADPNALGDKLANVSGIALAYVRALLQRSRESPRYYRAHGTRGARGTWGAI